jgi:transcriptional regulator with XRE-family HTH domain
MSSMTKLEAARRRAGLTQARLAAKARVHSSDVSKYERGWAHPGPKPAARIGKVLGVPPDELSEVADGSGAS